MRESVQLIVFSYFMKCTLCWWLGGSEEVPETGYAGYSGPLKEGNQNVQRVSWYEETKSKYHCGLFNWGRCSRYGAAEKYYFKCLDGWAQRTQSSDKCELAICDAKTNLMGACSIYYSNDYQKTRAGIIRSSGGSCTSPDTCTNCKTGYYSDGPYCRICGKIDHCNHRVCTTGSSQICEWCEGELRPEPYYRAYTQHLDNTQCQKACSWRADSTRCYPGECTNELASNCVCATNFGGTHCENINDSPDILYNFCEFSDTSGFNVLKNDPNWDLNNHPIIWTNFVAYKRIKLEIHAKYLQPADNRDPAKHYVRGFRVGVIEEKVTLSYYKGSTLNSVKASTCPGMDKSQPVDDKFCESSINSWTGFEHDDKVIAEFSSTNGGYVKVADREQSYNDGVINTYYYNGQTATREFEYHWDLVDPFHCSVSSGTSCSPFVDVGTDITDNPSITFTWDGWSDALSGLDHYEYDLFELKDGLELVDGNDKKQTNANVSVAESSATITMTEPGMYSIHMTAVDKAGNYMTGRNLFLFDDESVVDKQGDPTYCPTASEDTSYIWVVVDTDKVKVQFKDRFINTRHKNNRWLNGVQTYNPSKVIYEDLYGSRTNEPISHVHAIVDFQVSYEVHSAPDTVKDSRLLTSISQLKNQYDILTLNWADGDRLTSTVKAFDVLREFNEDTIVIYKDATPPLIENLWLTKGDRLNISVHNLEDFTQMTIEWEAYDIHSGMDSVYWKLYDYKTGDLHGYENIIAQGSAADISSCESQYGSYARGANCYCTPFQGCFHRHFQIKPEIKLSGGLLQNKDSGMHEYDYYIEVSVTNIANITTVLKKKITIDISPPHSGIVHDGIKGNQEIDYQQGTDLKAYWEEFFDRESGVFFYQYIVGTSCADKNDFTLDKTNPNLVETYNTFGSHTASVDGTYYFTVVAYNRALDPSDPVCSDGVTVDSSVPGVQEIVVENSQITGGLIKDSTSTNYYILGSNRMRRLIPNPTAVCVSRATLLNDIDLYPQEKFDNGSLVEVDGNVFCANSSGAPSNIGLTLYKSSLMEISWEPVDIPAKVYDYELGFSSTSGSAAPDIMAFESTKQHAHHRVVHTNIPDGTQFYIIIKPSTLGPCFMDTTPPEFVGGSSVFTVKLSGDYLMTSWPEDAVSDSEEFFELDYKFAVGHSPFGTDVQDFQPLLSGDSCTLNYPPHCTAVNISDMDWFLHGHHTYYVSIKITNSAGLVTIQTSDPYIHDVQLPAEGVIIDIDPQNYMTDIPLKDIEDVDFQTSTTSISARWSGFAHPHLNVTYKIGIGTTGGGSEVVSMKDVGTSLSHQESGLSLTPFETYYFTVTAVSSAGVSAVSSDGVTIITENDGLSGITIHDGKPCNMTDLTLGHHEDDNRLVCAVDADVQISTSSLNAYWSVPVGIQPYTTDAYIAIEKRTGVGNMWTIFRDFVHYATVFDVSINDLTLDPGIKYRIVLKLCARTICFQTVHTDGVMVIANPPKAGDITIEHLNTTAGNGVEKLLVSFTQFYDPDIEDTTEKYEAVDKYEFAITDNSLHGKPYMKWTNLDTYTPTTENQISFEYELNGVMDFSRCKRFSLRGYNNVKLYTTISTEIKDCDAYNPILIIPNIVIDAVGAPDALDSHGKLIYLEENEYWPEPDMDYTPYKNLISAAWPTLRHKDYDYAILDAKTVDVTTYYRQISQLSLTNPCDHPDSIRCGHTINGFMNEIFSNNELVHGTRYTVCVHTNPIQIMRETWIEYLKEINSCSDGIVVDLTPPVAGRLWIGLNPGIVYQISNTDLYINWDGFRDVEEYGTGPHATGIKEYILGIGTTPGGNDVYAFENVGVVQHKALHRLPLQNGYIYYATLKAVDFANRETVKISDPLTIDVTPPDRTNNPITLINRHITSATEISPCWKGVFVDLQSGLDNYLWSVGSQPGYTDMMSYIRTTDECGITDTNNPLSLLDGHSYYINVRAFNKAGLSSLATSWAFELDTTPPTPGHVYDGDIEQVTGNVKDIDYQTETKVLHAHWEGFHESHSSIKDYYVSIGTCPQCEDILGQQAIGIAYEFTLENTHLGTGLRYYTTVTACNTAEMCTTVTSDGVIIDNSPPTPGTVQDGTGYYDTEYQSMKNFISAKWYGFDDAQSGLEKYEWRVGTKPGYSDIVPTIELHLTETAALLDSSGYNLSLPINTRMYITVRAYNKAGLWAESSSSGFSVDDTPPVLSKVTTFSNDFGINEMTQIYRTTMKVEWEVEDAESFIKRQFLSIKSHIGGEFMLSSQPVNGIARSYVFTGLDLHDGVTYYVTLITCNSADICISDTSQGMFVDSTPPSRGMFAVSTDHASDPDLSRNEHGWMTYGSNAVYLAWLGFSDIHSQIDHYMVTVGSSYMAKNLNKDLETKYIHVDSNTDHGDEGKVQLYKIETVVLTQYDEVFITLWAVNKVGLRSHMIHSAFKKTPPSYLDLVRRCDALSCEGHCVCSPQDQKCPFNPNLGNCTDVSDSVFSSTQYTLLLVKDTNGYTTDDQAVTASDTVLRASWIISQQFPLNPYGKFVQFNVTASDSVLRASWIISQQFPSKPLWYEWSVGYADNTTPIGIYNPVEEKVWQDAGQLMDTVFTIGPDQQLLENTIKYSVFVRIWYTSDTYAVFKTDGIVVMTQTPALATVRGTAVIEKVLNTYVKDDDYMRIGRPITFMWKDKFLKAAATIEEYKLYISSFPGGYDILTIPADLDGTAEGFNMSRVNLSPGIKYYSNVIAYNYAGVHTTSTSDGFVIDHVDPSAGIVYDGLGVMDLEYKNSSDIVEAHWHGFIDTESGIRSYQWCVGETTFVHTNYDQSECDVLPWTNVGLHVSVSRNISTDIPHGTKIYNKVYAVDNVGRTSSIVISDGAIVDKTPPVSEKFIHIDDNIVDNPSFENTSSDLLSWLNVSTTDICMISSSYHPLSWTPDLSTCMAVISSQVNLAKDGQSFLFIRGNVKQKLNDIKIGCFYKISFFSSHLPITDSVGANKEGFVQLGNDKQVFLIYTKPYRHDRHGEGNGRADISWHAHTFYFKATNDQVNITIGSMDITTGIFIDNLSVQKVNLTTASSGGHVIGHVVYLHEWSSIHGSWSFTDPESPVIDYSWAIGYATGGTQIQPFKSVGLMNFGFNNNVTLVHNTYIYITAIATNGADLRGISYSDPILVDLTPPDIKFVNDGLGGDEDAWEFNEVVANWDYEDPESGILFCKWAVGYQPGGNELLPYTVITTLSAYKEFPYNVLIGRTIYTTLTCENRAGLISTLTADGVKISNQPPSIDTAVVETMPLSMTEYTPKINNQGVTDNIRLKWTGFADDIGVERFKVFYSKDGLSELMFFADVQDVLYAHFTETALTEGSYDFSVQAVNKLFKVSSKVKANSTVDTSVPTVDNSKNLALSWIDNKVIVSWDTIFSADDDLFYEVSSGSAQAGVNIIQWQETSNTSITFGIPASVSATTGLKVHVTVKAVSIGGHSAVKVGQFILP